MPKKKVGVIYIMTNASFPNWVKLGYSDDVYARLKQLNASEATPFPFKLYATYGVEERLKDQELHKLIDQLNPNLRARSELNGHPRVREFYAMGAEDAYKLLERIARISGTFSSLQRMQNDIAKEQAERSDSQAQDNATKKRQGPFRFFECGIPKGAELTFVKNPAVKCTVASNRTILYNGHETSLSALAQQLLGAKWPVQGTWFWLYNGERLFDLRAKKKDLKLEK